MSYDPNSTDSVLSRVLQRLDEQAGALARIEAGQASQGAEIGILKTWRTEIKTKVAFVSAAVSLLVAGLVEWWVNRHSN